MCFKNHNRNLVISAPQCDDIFFLFFLVAAFLASCSAKQKREEKKTLTKINFSHIEKERKQRI
jgi:hypothetical protein